MFTRLGCYWFRITPFGVETVTSLTWDKEAISLSAMLNESSKRFRLY